ncbi:MAG: hypothetical protein DI597_19440 [Pseudoxanthomonas spadix]|nr:MAG: hypothetical protein DI597_19440 [Pseudoxanthomonas spadix]
MSTEIVKALREFAATLCTPNAFPLQTRELVALLERSADEHDHLRAVCACAYQMAGFHDAPVEWMDMLGDAANGIPLEEWRQKGQPIEVLLPYHPASQTTMQLIQLLIQRDQAGRAKYGTTLDRTDLTREQWLQHLIEELLDGAGYALRAKQVAAAVQQEMEDWRLQAQHSTDVAHAAAERIAELENATKQGNGPAPVLERAFDKVTADIELRKDEFEEDFINGVYYGLVSMKNELRDLEVKS